MNVNGSGPEQFEESDLKPVKKKKQRGRLELVAVTVIITAVMTFMSTTALYGILKEQEPQSQKKINEALDIIDKYYLYDVDQEALGEATISAMVDALGDPYAFYLSKEDYQSYAMSINGTYYGIGVEIMLDMDGRIVVVNTFEDSPARNAGLESGDVILAVDDMEAEAAGFEKIADAIRGELGTPVTIRVQKGSNGAVEEVTAIRAQVHQESVRSEVLDENIGYISISAFDDQTGTDFSNQLNELQNQGVKALIIDARNNGGGLVSAAFQVADDLLDHKTVFYSVNKGGKKQEYRASKDACALPIVMLVNENSASATEILAGALKDNDRATLVGKKTFGKGIMQLPVELKDGSCIQVTIEKYLTPSGTDIHQKGIDPDYEVELQSTNDEQLQKAIELLQ